MDFPISACSIQVLDACVVVLSFSFSLMSINNPFLAGRSARYVQGVVPQCTPNRGRHLRKLPLKYFPSSRRRLVFAGCSSYSAGHPAFLEPCQNLVAAWAPAPVGLNSLVRGSHRTPPSEHAACQASFIDLLRPPFFYLTCFKRLTCETLPAPSPLLQLRLCICDRRLSYRPP
jgi:hypothetical protein